MGVRSSAAPTGIGGLVVEYIVAIDVTRVRFPADAGGDHPDAYVAVGMLAMVGTLLVTSSAVVEYSADSIMAYCRCQDDAMHSAC